MKKNYQDPSIKVVNVQPRHVISSSPHANERRNDLGAWG